MTYLVNEAEKASLHTRLNRIAILAEEGWDEPDSRTLGEIHSEINRIRTEMIQWAVLRPMEDGTEILESKVVAECPTHGLFFKDAFMNTKRTHLLESDCDLCELDEMERTEEAR